MIILVDSLEAYSNASRVYNLIKCVEKDKNITIIKKKKMKDRKKMRDSRL